MSADANSNGARTEITDGGPGNRSVVNGRGDIMGLNCLKEQTIQQQIIQLKKQQQIQQQILLKHFQVQQQQLAEQHEQQLRQHLKELWEKQREMEEQEQRERRELERIESLKKKEKHEESAIASSEVKQKLQGFLLNKKHREAVAASTSSQNQNILQSEPNVASGTPYCLNSLLGKYDDDFPLRKTASEPNLLKMRRKQRVYERRCSPLARKKDPRLHSKRKSLLAIEVSNSNSDSGPNSPPVLIGSSQVSPSGTQNTSIQEETEPYNQHSDNSNHTNESISDMSLYSSPSLPNISLGRPPSSSDNSRKLAPVSEAEIRAAFTARLGMPLTGHLLPTTLPYYPTLPGIETVAPEYSNPTSPAYMHRQMQALEQSTQQPYFLSVYESPPPITDSQVAYARLNKQGHRPLGRTQSAPLPLGHPMLTAVSGANNLMVHYEDSNEQHMQQQEQQISPHKYLKQQIRQTVLTRAESRNQLTNVVQNNKLDEANDIESEVIDLTNRNNFSITGNRNCEQPARTILQKNMLQSRGEITAGSVVGGSHVVRPLARAFSSPLVALGSDGIQHPQSVYQNADHSVQLFKSASGPHRLTTALAFDNLMLKHSCICGDNSSHPEHGGRLQSVWARLVETGLVARCDRLRSRKATLEELQTCHSEAHTLLFGTNPTNRQKLDMNKLSELTLKSFVRLSCGGIGVDSDTTWNEAHTAPAARMAVGCVTDLAFKAAAGDIKNGFAIVRPPGHHAERSAAMGFCFFNSVAIAAKLLQQKMDLKRILIVDWDVHHGNGTQQIFYEDKRVLYISIHRHDDGNFFPGTGASHECGGGSGLGYNVNIAWSGGLNPPMADAEYLAAFRTVVMPIAKEYVPDIVLVSAGFDAAIGHPPPLGGYGVSAACFGYMTQQLTQLADGKVILALEGGYDLPAICDCSEECVRALLDYSSSPISENELRRPPCKNAVDTLQKTLSIQLPHWPTLKKLAHTVAYSAVDAAFIEENDTVNAMASLSMNKRNSSHLKKPAAGISVEPMEQDDIK